MAQEYVEFNALLWGGEDKMCQSTWFISRVSSSWNVSPILGVPVANSQLFANL